MPPRQVNLLSDSRCAKQVNVSAAERGASAVFGGVLAAWGLLRRGRFSWPAVLLGVPLLHRAITGHCVMYGMLGINRAESQPPQELPQRSSVSADNRVEEASRESFPASDAPSYTPGRA